MDTWQGGALPRGIRVILSFAEPMETVSGELDVAPEDQIARVIAIDRTRSITFKIEAPPSDEQDT